MLAGPLRLSLYLLLVCISTADNLKKNITIGYLPAIKGEMRDRQGRIASGAIQMAVDKVNMDDNLLANVSLVLQWNDTRGDTVIGTKIVTDMLFAGVNAFFGPEGSCYVEAIVAQAWNVPMFGYRCSDSRATDVPTFVRTDPPDTQVTKSILALLKYYDWRKFCIVWEDEWSSVANSLYNEAGRVNMTVTCKQKVSSSNKCCKDNLPCCKSDFWPELVEHTRNITRIYVFLGQAKSLLDMMDTMQAYQLFDNGEYLVIFADLITYSKREAYKYIWRYDTVSKNSKTCIKEDFLQRSRSLLVVVPSPPVKTYENFTSEVAEYNKKPPFNFPLPGIFNDIPSGKLFITVTAANLYDSVFLYARALDKLLKNETYLNDTIIDDIAKNGSVIVQTIIKDRKYKSITGTTMKLDQNGDSEGNFSVLAIKRGTYQIHFTDHNFSCDYHMVAVAQFQEGDLLPEYKLMSPSLQPDWAGGLKPDDEPNCGFNNERCGRDESEESGMILAGLLGVLLFCSSVLTLSIYRKWKIEQEIEGLLWKIDEAELYQVKDMVGAHSKISLTSAASIDSKVAGQVFADTLVYRGLWVRIKELKFSKKKDVTRETMKEMRRLREIRHDNVNSFIGASVEPMRILIVTDYCAKGSLYDIVENEDIKLDNMFIASLVHDLIKGMFYLHYSAIICHGNLKSSNCVVTSRWVLQVADFGLHELRQSAENDSIGDHQLYRNMLWKAPELLRDPSPPVGGTFKADVYAFAIVLYELVGRKGPFGSVGNVEEPRELVKKIKDDVSVYGKPYRPEMGSLREDNVVDDLFLRTIEDCWTEDPELRPDFRTIRVRLKRLRDNKQKNIMDQMMDMMEKYANNLEELVNQRTQEVHDEKKKTEDLLHRMLPAPVAAKLTRGDGVKPESFDRVTIYFSDIVGFTQMSAESTPLEVVSFLNDLYTLFDKIIKGYDVYKVETIGDAYMVVSGLPIRNGDRNVGEIASMALDVLRAVKNYKIAHRPGEQLQLRIGIHTGPVVAGVVGLTMPRYCLFGDTVNTASRMESNGLPLKIHISPQCRQALLKLGGYEMEERGLITLKGKGEVMTYWLMGATDQAIKSRQEVDLDKSPPLFCGRHSPKSVGEVGRRNSSAPRGLSMDRGPLPLHQRHVTAVTCSLDPFPEKRFHNMSSTNRSYYSLQENNICTLSDDPPRDGVVGNGGMAGDPLLDNGKRWHSLENIPLNNFSPKTMITQSSIRSWLATLFTNGYRNSDISLRKPNCNYSDLQVEKESIV